ncbi:MAG: TldD/PmbA family protein, partial [Actinomycetota bacterium]
VYEGEIEQLSSAETQGAGIRVVVDGRQGFAYAGTLDEGVLKESLEEARDNAVFGSPDPHYGLAEPDGVAAADLDLFRPELADFATDRKVELAMELERATLGADARISGMESSDYVDSIAEGAVATNTGIRASDRQSICYLAAYSMATEAEETQTGFGFSVGRAPDDLDVAVAAGDAADRATRLLGAKKPRSQRLTVILDPWVTAQFLSVLSSTLNGEAVLKGRSLFADRLGDDVASPLLSLVDDPTDPRAMNAGAFDDEGLATRRNTLIDTGRLKQFVQNTYTGRRSGTASTGSAVRSGFKSTPGVGCRALALTPGTKSQADLIAEIDNGLLVQSVSGLHSGVNPVSGDFSTGAEGLHISGGSLGAPQREFTIASTIQRMLKDVTAVGSDLTWLPMSAAGVSLVIGDVTMSGA